jgi:uncharacterized protein YukE
MPDQEPLAVSPDSLKATAQHLAAVSSKMKTVLSTLQGKLAGEGQPWGNDGTGRTFADGPNGYLAQVDWVNGSVGAKTDLLDQYSQQMTDTAESLRQQDDA